MYTCCLPHGRKKHQIKPIRHQLSEGRPRMLPVMHLFTRGHSLNHADNLEIHLKLTFNFLFLHQKHIAEPMIVFGTDSFVLSFIVQYLCII